MHIKTKDDMTIYNVISHYANMMYEGIGYVTIDYLIGITGYEHVIIINVLQQMGFIDNPIDSDKWVHESDLQ